MGKGQFMGIGNGRRSAVGKIAVRGALMAALVLLGPLVSACTTTEGTNALVDPVTFEREVMKPTLVGLDLLPKSEKEAPNIKRGPLVMPKQTAYLPPPSTEDAAALPPDNGSVQINTAGLTQQDLQRLRNARVVDLNTIAGRPLTSAEQKQLTARMQMAHMDVATNSDRPLSLPPASYFTNVGGKDTVCKAANGQLVALNDSRCPEQVRKAISNVGPGPVSTSLFAQQAQTMNQLSNPQSQQTADPVQ
jgi:hypothetical protein